LTNRKTPPRFAFELTNDCLQRIQHFFMSQRSLRLGLLLGLAILLAGP
jgi:hypothetical protein